MVWMRARLLFPLVCIAGFSLSCGPWLPRQLRGSDDQSQDLALTAPGQTDGQHGNTSSDGSSGCALASSDTGVKNVSIRVGSTQRSFIRVVNKNYDHTRKHALIIGYHGLGLDGNSPRNHHKWPVIETMAGDEAIFVYANAMNGSWTGGGSSPDVYFFDEIVKTTGEQYCLDKNRVFVHGFSNGAFFVNSLVAVRPGAIRAAIAVAGGGGGSKLPVMVVHGTGDPNVGYWSGMQSVSAYARANGCNANVNFGAMKMGACQVVDGCSADYPVIFCPWNGNHHWPEFTLADVWQFIASFK